MQSLIIFLSFILQVQRNYEEFETFLIYISVFTFRANLGNIL